MQKGRELQRVYNMLHFILLHFVAINKSLIYMYL